MPAGAVAPSSPAPTRSRELLGVTQSPSSVLGSPPFFATQAPDLWPRQGDGSCPSPSRTPNEVVVQISSQVTISNYATFYPSTPIQQFRMTYSTLADGSLLSPAYTSEVRKCNWFILFVGMMLMLFLRNSIVSLDYIRRGRVKYKGLFYALLSSQLFGVGAHIALAGTFVIEAFSCGRSLMAAAILTELSSALLLAVILGVKAYRCLGSPKFVLIIVSTLQAASSALSFASVSRTATERSNGFSCGTMPTSVLFSIATALRSILSLFICLCFLYALAKSIKCPAAQGRISLRLSNYTNNEPVESEKDNQPKPRGWWDYVPNSQESPAPTWNIVDEQGFLHNMRTMFGGWTGEAGGSLRPQSKEPGYTTMPEDQTPHRSRRSTVRFSDRPESGSRVSISVRSPSPAPSKARSLSSLLDRMKPFREFMKNELAQAALITFFNVVATVLGLVGAFGHVPIPQEVFISSYWGILSLLVIHSFGRVIKRLEREALIQHPSTWDPLYHVEKATNGRVRPGLSTTASVASNPFRGRSMTYPGDNDEGAGRVGKIPVVGVPTASTASENPFEDFESVTQLPYRQWQQAESLPQAAHPQPTREDSLLPVAPHLQASSSSRASARNSRSMLLRPMSQMTTSEYSFGSSNRQSLFYLEEQQL